MKQYTIVTMSGNGISYSYLVDVPNNAPTFKQALKMIKANANTCGHDIKQVLAIIETPHNGFVASSGLTFKLGA